jgi:hypothetical protein
MAATTAARKKWVDVGTNLDTGPREDSNAPRMMARAARARFVG